MGPSRLSSQLRGISADIDGSGDRVCRDRVIAALRQSLAAATAAGEAQVVVMSFIDWEDDESRNEVLDEHFGGTAWSIYSEFVILSDKPLGLDDNTPVRILDLRTDTDEMGQAVPASAPSLRDGLEIPGTHETEEWLGSWERITSGI